MTIQGLIEALNERTLAWEVGIPHDEALNTFNDKRAVVKNFHVFTSITTKFFRYAENCVFKIYGFKSSSIVIDFERCSACLSSSMVKTEKRQLLS